MRSSDLIFFCLNKVKINKYILYGKAQRKVKKVLRQNRWVYNKNDINYRLFAPEYRKI